MAATIGRRAYAEMYGPTVGDRVRLADTELIIEVEQDGGSSAGGTSHTDNSLFVVAKVVGLIGPRAIQSKIFDLDAGLPGYSTTTV